MAITSADIKLMQPERLTDDPDGGGQMTGLEVVDGDINNLFEDVSRIDRTYGSVSLRKAFLKVDTDTSDLYLDAHSIISAQPADPNVSGLIFSTDDFYDERVDSRQRIESFVIAGPVTGYYLRGDQLEGQQTIICYAPAVNNPDAPDVGETFMLQIGEDESTRQFVKVLNVTRSTETFTYQVSGGDIRTFNAHQYILELSAPLARDYPASDPNPRPNNDSKIYSTQPSVSAQYYGTTTLAAGATSGDSSVQVAETFAPIIPTASNETPVIDQRPGGYLSQVVPATDSTISISVNPTSGSESQLPTAMVPGTLSITLSGTQYTDRGGVFVNSSGNQGPLEGTTIDYRSGVIAWALSDSSAELSYKPGSLRQQLPNTGQIRINETNRSFNYVLSLDPIPAPTAFHASYQYLGKWYTLEDDGSGRLVGDGSGEINYDTGSVILTLQAQPDASSKIFYRWVEGGIYGQNTDEAFSSTTPATLTLENDTVVPSSVTITWTAGGTQQTATDPNGDGQITGDATGEIDYAEGVIQLTSGSPPDQGTSWSVEYTHKSDPRLSTVTTIPDNDTQADITLQTDSNVEPGSINFTAKSWIRRVVESDQGVKLSENFWELRHQCWDNGDGAIITRRAGQAEAIGSVNYTTGEIVLTGTSFLKVRNN